MVRYGILGMAGISPRFIAGIEASEGSKVEAIYSSKPHDYEGVPHYTDVDDLLNDENVDIIYIPTPNYLHAEHIERSLKAGKHVVCEKPLVLTSDDAKRLYDLAKSLNLFLMEAQKVVFLPVTNWLKTEIANWTLGTLKSVRMEMWFPKGDRSHWMYDETKGGGVVYASANYPVEYMMYLLDTLDIDHKSSDITKGPNNIDERIDFEFEIKGVDVSVTISRIDVLENYAEFVFDNGSIKIPDFWKAKNAFINGEEKIFEDVSEFKYEVDHIKECLVIRQLTSNRITPAMSIRCVEYIETLKDLK